MTIKTSRKLSSGCFYLLCTTTNLLALSLTYVAHCFTYNRLFSHYSRCGAIPAISPLLYSVNRVWERLCVGLSDTDTNWFDIVIFLFRQKTDLISAHTNHNCATAARNDDLCA